MITVYVWKFRGKSEAWGHASMKVDGGTPEGEIYISWWPQGTGRETQIPKSRGTMLENVYSVAAIPDRMYEDDVHDEEQGPDYICYLKGEPGGLNETAIKKWFADLVASGQPWTTLGSNCSTTVARALKAGDGDSFTEGFQGWWNSWNVVWTPGNVIEYCEELRKGGLAAK